MLDKDKIKRNKWKEEEGGGGGGKEEEESRRGREGEVKKEEEQKETHWNFYCVWVSAETPWTVFPLLLSAPTFKNHSNEYNY